MTAFGVGAKATLQVTGSSIISNTVSNQDGGGLYNAIGAGATLAGTEVAENTAPNGDGGGIANANRLVAMSGFFGQRDANLTERFSTMGQHHGPPTLQQQIETGSIVCGSPVSVAAQLKRLSDSIGCGVVELSFSAPGGSREAKLHSMELFASQVLPKVRDL